MKTFAIFHLLGALQTAALVHAQEVTEADSSGKHNRYLHAALAGQPAKVNARLSAPARQAQNLSGDVLEAWKHRYSLWLIAPTDGASAMASDKFGNIYVTGASSGLFDGNQDTDYATAKYEASGTQQWVARYKSPGHSYDMARAIVVDVAGNVYVTGNSGAYPGCDYATVKYSSAGTEEWVARYTGLKDSSEDYALALAVDAAGNVYVTGESGEDYATVKYNSSGMEQWASRFNGPANSYDVAHALAVDDSGNIYVTGSGGTVKYNSAGVQEWVAHQPGAALAMDGGGNLYVTGYCVGSSTGSDYATVKYNSAGAERWVARHNGPGNGNDFSTALALDSAGNVYVTGVSGGDYATVKYDSTGKEQWVSRYNGPGNSADQPTALAVGPAGNIYVTGYSSGSGTSFDYATIKYNTAGAEQLVIRYNGPGNHDDYASALVIDQAGNVFVTGSSGTIKYNSTGRR